MYIYIKGIFVSVVALIMMLVAVPVSATVIIIDTTKVGGWQPQGVSIIQADTVEVWLELTDEPSPINYVNPPFPPNEHSIKFHVRQVGASFFNVYTFRKEFNQPFFYVPGGAGIVDLGAEITLNNPVTAQPYMKIGFLKNGVLYESPWVIPSSPPAWEDRSFWPIQDWNGNNPPQNADGYVEIDNLLITLKNFPYNVADGSLYIDNVKTNGKMVIDAMGDGDFTTGIVPLPQTTPTDYSLSQNFPNPFNPTTSFYFSLPRADKVTITIYNALGQVIETETKNLPPGKHRYDFTADNMPNGIYFYQIRVRASGFSKTKKMVLMK